MKIQQIIGIIVGSIILSQATIQGQVKDPNIKEPKKTKMVKGEKDYDKFAYIDAAKTYERIANKGYKSVDLFQKLGNSYYFNAELPQANKWYGQLFDLNQEVEPEYYYRYSQTLKSVGDYKKADIMLAEFNKKSGNDLRAQLYQDSKDYLKTIQANSGRYKVQNAGINSKYSDYGSIILGNKLIFASSRETGEVGQRKAQWNGQSYTNLFASEINQDGTLSKPEKYNKQINSKFNEATPVFTKDGKTMYFTRNNYNNGKKGQDEKEITKLKIYKAIMVEGQWSDITELPFNSDQYSVAHPALSPEENYLYFASDMPGTLGESDLFKVKINPDGTFGTPENLGKTINTPGRETFPYITSENELYFATDGHPGLGGLDIFVSKLDKNNNNSPTKPINLGGPVNDKTDDFAFIINNTTLKGYFTSNREKGQGFDDIYSFTETKKPICEQELIGTVTDETTGEILANATLILSDSSFKELKTITSDQSGNYKFAVECGQTYYIKTSKEAYETKETKITISNQSGQSKQPIQLVKKVIPVKVGDNLADVFKIKMIYFDLDKSYIRPDAALELEKILDVMKQYPTMKIDVRSHTDSRQTALYNAALSERRAKSTIEWLVSKGVDASRLTGKGYGESKLTNKCADGVECSQEEHQANRRSEFIIVAL
jgi:outer membrane protein OmpA-like peptidoglycan-associated protein/tetratricopeptide (TPR) repeat protein